MPVCACAHMLEFECFLCVAFMCRHARVFACVCVGVCTYVCGCTHIHVYTQTHACTHIHTHTRTNVHTHPYAHIRTHMYITQTHAHAHMRAHIKDVSLQLPFFRTSEHSTYHQYLWILLPSAAFARSNQCRNDAKSGLNGAVSLLSSFRTLATTLINFPQSMTFGSKSSSSSSTLSEDFLQHFQHGLSGPLAETRKTKIKVELLFIEQRVA